MTQQRTKSDISPDRVDLRDTFAAAALTGLLSRSIAPEQAMSQYVRIAATYADAMLRERERTNHDAAPKAKATNDGGTPKDADGTGSTPSKAEIDALEFVVEEGRIASMDDYGILRSLLIRLRPEWENQSYEESDEKRTNTTMSRDATPGEGSVQGEGTVAPAAWLAVAADGSESSAVYLLKEHAEAAAREWGWFVAPLYALPVLRAEDEIAIEAAWERTGLTPTWPADEAGCGVKYANAMADEIMRLRSPTLTAEEREAVEVATQCVQAQRAQHHPEETAAHELLDKSLAKLRSLLERLK
jgi:hypothetical protein